MQFVNDDMDELFRQAAKDYPLNTDSGDWNAVLNKMQGGNNDNVDKKSNGRKYLFFLLLIPLLIICTTYIKNDPANTANKSLKTEVPATQNSAIEKTINATNERNMLTTAGENEMVSSSTNSENVTSSLANKEKTDFFTNTIITTSINKNTTGNRALSSTNFKLTNASKAIKSDDLPSINSFNSSVDNNTKDLEKEKGSLDITTQPETSESLTQTALEKTATKTNKEPAVAANKNEKKERQPRIRATKFYYGFQLGPDFSMVKSTKIDGTGYSAGLIAGYNISRKFAIETGLLWDHKRYQSDGQYFSTDKLDWPHVKILDLSGYCNMYEVPLNIRYNFSRNSKRTLYAAAGISSYLMKKENYDYNYVRYGAYGYGNREYKNTTNNWLSVAHVSVGVQKKLGAIGDLRIEPYIKLPLHGVGIGSMPLRSTGIYLGITRPIR